MKIIDILSLPDAKIALAFKERKKRRVYTRDQLVSHLKKHNIRTRRQLSFHNGPSVFTYIKEFGSWRNATKFVFGISNEQGTKRPFLLRRPKYTAMYLVNLVIQLNLWSSPKYLRASQIDPITVPPFYFVKKKFVRFSNLLKCARAVSLKMMLQDYLNVTNKLGKIPNVREIEKEGLDFTALFRMIGNKMKTDEMVYAMWRKQKDENQTRSS